MSVKSEKWPLQLMSSNTLFYPTNSPKPKDIQFAIIENKENKQMLIFVNQLIFGIFS